MGLPQTRPLLSVDDYLTRERAAKERHEFLDGQVFAMAGESGEHGDISVNLVGIFYNQLKGTPCRARTKDTKVRSGPTLSSGHSVRGLFSYPDVVVVCGTPEYFDDHADVILNPTAILEVLSPSTEAFDRGAKFHRYQTWNPSLRDYLLVSQNQPQIELFSRQDEGHWSYQRAVGLDAVIAIPSIHCSLKLADVYDRITFPEV